MLTPEQGRDSHGKTSVQKLAGVLKLLVTITFICNLVALFFVPGCSRLRSLDELVGGALYFSNESSLAVTARMMGYFVSAWQEVWLFGGPYAAVLTSFLLFCGVCTAVILWAGPPGAGHHPGREHFHL